MKLKKIASLMLAGIMAVSMLAGCKSSNNGGNGNDNDDTTVVPSTSAIVTAFNNGQDEANDAKVNFTSDASLDAALKKAVENAGDRTNTTQNAVATFVTDLLGETWDSALYDKDSARLKDGMSATIFSVKPYYSNTYWTEEDAVNAAARDIDDVVAEFDATTKKDGLKIGAKYYDYSYTGTVSMVSAQQEGGNTVYFVAYTITQTVAEKTVTK